LIAILPYTANAVTMPSPSGAAEQEDQRVDVDLDPEQGEYDELIGDAANQLITGVQSKVRGRSSSIIEPEILSLAAYNTIDYLVTKHPDELYEIAKKNALTMFAAAGAAGYGVFVMGAPVNVEQWGANLAVSTEDASAGYSHKLFGTTLGGEVAYNYDTGAYSPSVNFAATRTLIVPTTLSIMYEENFDDPRASYRLIQRFGENRLGFRSVMSESARLFGVDTRLGATTFGATYILDDRWGEKIRFSLVIRI